MGDVVWRQTRNVDGSNVVHDSNSTGRRGQNQPMSAKPDRTEPQVRYQGLKIEPAKPMLTATAVINGQMLDVGSTYR